MDRVVLVITSFVVLKARNVVVLKTVVTKAALKGFIREMLLDLEDEVINLFVGKHLISVYSRTSGIHFTAIFGVYLGYNAEVYEKRRYL